MRINVYSQELTKEVTRIKKESNTGIIYYGVRIYFASPDILHHTSEDDDRSAITFWLPNDNSFTEQDLAEIFENMASIVWSLKY